MRTDAASRRALTLQGLAAGKRPEAIASELGISVRSVHRYAESGRDELRAMQAEALAALTGQAIAAGAEALAVLRTIAVDATAPAAARVSASGRILDTLVRLVETRDLAERVAALEALLAEVQGELTQRRGAA